MAKKIWFNHWFSSVIYIFDYIKQRNKDSKVFRYSDYDWSDFCIYATNNVESPLIAKYADYWELEPKSDNEMEYVFWCLEFIERNGIELFIPRLHKDWISKHKDKFYSIGCKVDYLYNTALSSKSGMYELLKKKGFTELIPTYRVVDSKDSFCKAISELGRLDLCMKKDVDEGGTSFVRLRDGHLDGMYGYLTGDLGYSKYIDIDLVSTIFDENLAKSRNDKFLVMPYLSQEVSCDCMYYHHNEKFICITREKSINHIEKVRLDKKMQEVCQKLCERLFIHDIVNVQFRYEGNTLKLIDINYRMSGGIYKSCEASSVNLPLLLVDLHIGKGDLEVKYDPVFLTGKDILIQDMAKPIPLR